MAGNPRDNAKGKGFWDGGGAGQSENGQSAGRPSGFPGSRSPKHAGLRTDLEFPAPAPPAEDSEATRKA